MHGRAGVIRPFFVGGASATRPPSRNGIPSLPATGSDNCPVVRGVGCYCTVQPPSTSMVWPVMLRAAGDMQERGDAGEFVEADEHALGHRLEHHVADHLRFGNAARARLVGDLLVDQRGFHVGRADRVDGDVGVGGLQRDDLGEAEQAVLGRDVGALVGTGDQRVDRADVDDAAEAAFAHAGQNGAGQARDADEHHLHQEVPLLHRELLQRRDVLQPGVVDQHVDRTRDVLQRAAATLSSEVTSSTSASAEPPSARIVGRDGFGGVAVDVGDDEMVAGGGQFGGDAGADAAAGAGDEDAAGAHGR